MNANRNYRQVIEWEYVDTLTSNNIEFSVVLLFYIAEVMNNNSELSKHYKFDIMSYGWLGFYPAIRVEFISEKAVEIEEEYIDREFKNIISNNNINDLIIFAQNNYKEIKEIVRKINKMNTDSGYDFS